MSGKEEFVEVTAKVPKRLMRLLEAENFFDWDRDDFWTASVIRSVSCEMNELDYDKNDGVGSRIRRRESQRCGSGHDEKA